MSSPKTEKHIIRFTGTDFLTEVSKGRIKGHSGVHKFGRVSVAQTEFLVWPNNSVYVYPASAMVMKISSSNTNDSSAGTGARTVNIEGLDSDFSSITEDVILNGQTPVNTTKLFSRVFTMSVLTGGSTGSNQGILYAGASTVTNGVPLEKYALIDTNKNHSEMALYTTPRKFHGFILRMQIFSSSNKEMNATVLERHGGGVFQVKETLRGIQTPVEHQVALPHHVPPKSDIEMRATVSSASADVVTGNIEILLVASAYIDNIGDL